MADQAPPANSTKLKLKSRPSSHPHITFPKNIKCHRRENRDAVEWTRRRSLFLRNIFSIDPSNIKDRTTLQQDILRKEREINNYFNRNKIFKTVLKLNNTSSDCLSNGVINTFVKRKRTLNISRPW
ncbi:uncharacterized protein LOC143147355 isoform X1 [Ptiloglossa arizonensis]|uniref:uncharacterized protein LOC143147355 isoform X1 n=1 Tax=Ptiloglossa arizonensis TaxID=3350558 RepID=UPI003F9FCC18